MILTNIKKNNISRNNYLNYISNILGTNLDMVMNGATNEERERAVVKLLETKDENVYNNPFSPLLKKLGQIILMPDYDNEKLKEYIDLIRENINLMQEILEKLVVFKETPTNVSAENIYDIGQFTE